MTPADDATLNPLVMANIWQGAFPYEKYQG
jgi:hypothetical protein